MATGAKRNAEQRERDLVFISEGYLEGKTQAQIAAELSDQRPYSLSRSTISLDLKLIHERWIETQLANFDLVKARELSRIDKLEREYWEAWERSTQKRVDLKTEVRDGRQFKISEDDEEGKPHYKNVKRIREEYDQIGNADYLKGIERCIQLRIDILGLKTPTRINVDYTHEAAKYGIDEDMIDNLADNLVEGMIRNVTTRQQHAAEGAGGRESPRLAEGS